MSTSVSANPLLATVRRLTAGERADPAELTAAFDLVLGGDATPAQIGGFLIALRLKGETADEIAGCAEAMRAHVLPVRPGRADLVDTAGTGGDGGRTFNISTAAALVAAAAGAAVAKHGNRAVSSASGSADVLEALGFSLEQRPERIARRSERERWKRSSGRIARLRGSTQNNSSASRLSAMGKMPLA